VAIDGGHAYWVEGRPTEGGRYVLVRRRPDGAVFDVSPPGFNVRTRVHEYGGGAYVVSAGEVFFSNFSDQRIYRIRVSRGAGSAEQDRPDAVTPAGTWFYADAVVDDRRRRLVCLREDHTRSGEPVNTIVSIPLGPSAHREAPSRAHLTPVDTQSAGDVIVAGHDFYSTPRLSPDGSHL